jgi:hypothetical protein
MISHFGLLGKHCLTAGASAAGRLKRRTKLEKTHPTPQTRLNKILDSPVGCMRLLGGKAKLDYIKPHSFAF